MLFDLDDTLLNRDGAVEILFSIILEKCYENIKHSVATEMLHRFKDYDKEEYGYSDKTNVLESLFNYFPPQYRLPREHIQEFWNHYFPQCFSVNQDVLNIVNLIKMHVKVAIITNGTTQRQNAKIHNTNLNSCFDIIIISEEVGLSKPDNRIFEMALKKLDVKPEEALFIGDDIEKDIAGCQNANIDGIWFNPHRIKNDTNIRPYAEIDSLDKLLTYFTY
ncbi:HAD family hydrolase [Bacillus sp. AK128]